MDKFCHSCAAPLSNPDFKSEAENYCPDFHLVFKKGKSGLG